MIKTILSVRRTPKGEKSERRVEGLLAVARDVFAERGYEKTTTAEIAQRLGISEATVFSYFGSKRQLCIEVIKRWYDQISGELEREVPIIAGTQARLHYVIRRHLSHLMGNGTGICALVLGEGRVADQAFTVIITDLKRRYTAPFMRSLQAAIDSGEMRGDMPARLMRDMTYGAMEHILWGYVATNRKPPLDETADQLTEMLMNAFSPRTPENLSMQRFRSDVYSAIQRLEKSADTKA